MKYLLFMFTFVAFLFQSLMLTSGNGIISLLKTEILKCLSYCTLIPVCIYIWSFKTLGSTLSILWPIQGLTIRGHSGLDPLPTDLSVYRDRLLVEGHWSFKTIHQRVEKLYCQTKFVDGRTGQDGTGPNYFELTAEHRTTDI